MGNLEKRLSALRRSVGHFRKTSGLSALGSDYFRSHFLVFLRSRLGAAFFVAKILIYFLEKMAYTRGKLMIFLKDIDDKTIKCKA